jgi:hypothetical protein
MVGMTTDDPAEEDEVAEQDAFIDIDPLLPSTSGASIASTTSSKRSSSSNRSSSSSRSNVSAEDCCVVDFAPSARGLESFTPVGARQKKILILDGMCSVFLEQERQRQQYTYYNADLIRNAYVAYSYEAAHAAATLGLQDQRISLEIQQEEADGSDDLELSRLMSEEDVDDDTNDSSKKVHSSVGGDIGSGDPDVDNYHPVSYFERVSIASTAETDHSTDLQPHSSNDGASGGRAAHNHHHRGGRKRRSIVKRLLTGSHFR